MARSLVYRAHILFYLQFFITGCLSIDLSTDIKVLNVGEELQQETIPLQNGSRIYNIVGPKGSKWYEVKISYPASIPSSFSIQLESDLSDFGLNRNRRLLSTEKLIFKVENHNWTSGDSKLYVLVTVEPEGIVGRFFRESCKCRRENLPFLILFVINLALGIPYDAWRVGILVLFCLGLALIIHTIFHPIYYQMIVVLHHHTSLHEFLYHGSIL